MALKKEYTQSNGLTGEYWKTIHVSFGEDGHGSYMSKGDMALWKNQEYRELDGNLGVSKCLENDQLPLHQIKIADLNLEPDASVWDAMRKAFYHEIKKTEEFENSEDLT